MEHYFQYGEKEISYLTKRDKKMAEVIRKIGPVKREVIPDLFTALVSAIIGQQISTKAYETIWNRIRQHIGTITPEHMLTIPSIELKQLGISLRKAEFIRHAAQSILEGTINLNMLNELNDEEICKQLTQLKGIGVWSAEMLMLFSLQRPNIISYNDMGIQRGLRMIYHHHNIDRNLFEKYRKRFSPYCSVASLYLWAVAGGAIPEMEDYSYTSKTKQALVV